MLKKFIFINLVLFQSFFALGQTYSINLDPQQALAVKSRIEKATLKSRLFCLRRTLVPSKKKPTYKTETYFAGINDLPLESILLTMKTGRLINADIPDREFDILVMSNEDLHQPVQVVLRFNAKTFEFISYSYSRSKLTGISIEDSQVKENTELQVEESCS